MTPLGKMLSIFVFLLSLVWAYLTVNTFVSRTNWKAEAEKYQKAAAETSTGADAIVREAEAERQATKAKLLAAERDRDAAVAKAASLSKEVDELKVNIDAKLAAAAAANPEVNKDNSRQKELQTEVGNLTVSLKDAQDQVVALTKDTSAAKILQEQAQREAAAERQRAATLENQLRTTDDKLKETLARLKAGVGEGVAVRPSPPEGFRGTVKAVSSNGEFVEITPGASAGLRENTKLQVVRLKPPTFLGHLIVRGGINPDSAACQFIPAKRPRNKPLSADDLPKPGDLVQPDNK